MSEQPANRSTQPAGALAADHVTFFTWNVHLNNATLELACRHLARRQGTCVAALVEVPHGVRDEDIDGWSAGKLRRLTSITGIQALAPTHHVIIVGSHDVGVDPTRSHEPGSDHDSNRRMQGLSLFSTAGAWTNLQVLGIHGQDRVNYPTERERQHWGRCMRDTLGDFWTGGPLVVLGDLNANPFHDEITEREGLFALRKKDGLGVRRKLSNERTEAISLYNPMWQLLRDSSDEALGTYYFAKRHRTELLWHCVDQIIVSSHLEPHLLGPPHILTRLTTDAEILLLNAEGVPIRDEEDKPAYTDHLPVQLSVDIKKVESCKISAKP